MLALRFGYLGLVLVLSFNSRAALAAEPAADTNAVWLAEHYTKYEHRIPMRDGVRLFTLEHTTGYPRSYPVHDQRFAASRPDVLVYETEPLEEDLTFAGPLKATLHVSTTGTDADRVVKLVDVYAGDFPDPKPNPADIAMGGYQQLVRGR